MNDLIRQDAIDLDIAQNPVSAVAVYLARLSAGSRRTMANALMTIAQEFSHGRCGIQDFPWWQLRYEHTQAMRAKLSDRYAPATANKMLSALRGVLQECWRLGTMTVEELHRASDLRPVKGTRTPKGRALNEEQLQALLRNANSVRDQTLILFLARTGLRRDEAERLTWLDLDYQTHVALVRGKGDKERQVPVPRDAWCAVLSVPTRSQPDLPIFQITAGRIWQVVRDASFRAQVEVVTPHDLRRTYATRLLQGDVDLATVQKLMGHSSPTTTAGYDRRSLDEATAAVQRVFSQEAR
jgi:integrase